VDDLHPLGGEPFGDGAPDAVGAAGYHRDAPGEAPHCCSYRGIPCTGRLPGFVVDSGGFQQAVLGLVGNGDTVTIAPDKRVLDPEVPADELERRRAASTAPAASGEKGWLSSYQRTVGRLPEGATLHG
jgi:hypothetical protein